MKSLLKILFGLAILGAIGYGSYFPIIHYWNERNKPAFRTAKVESGKIVAVVNSTGTVKPKIQVAIGSFVSGPILELYCEFNQEVKKGDLLAKIDPQIYEANVARDKASLANRQADVNRVRAQLQQAINDEKRAVALQQEDESFIAQAEMDKIKFSRLSLEAQLQVSNTSVDQAQATLENSLANLNYTFIRSPVDGIVIDRKIDPGQTLAAQFQTPELFIVAPEMRKEMHIHASVDEADIGLIQAAQEKKFPVTFTVDAYPDELFEGRILEIRLSATTLQNVVTYPVIVATANPELKLLPGMTASLSFKVNERTQTLKIPNSALRFYPNPQHVRKEDQPILEGKNDRGTSKETDEEAQQSADSLSAAERAQLRVERNQRHVWILSGDKLRAVSVVTGLSDSQHTELVKGDLKQGDLLVTGVMTVKPGVSR